MRLRSWFPVVVLLAGFAAGPVHAGDRSLVIIFGPAGEKPGSLAVHSAAGTLRNWLRMDGAGVELRQPGAPNGQQLTRNMPPKDLDQALLDAARGARDTDLPGFVDALDQAADALARRPGKRLLMVFLENPGQDVLASVKGGSEEIRSRLNHTIDLCRANSVSIIVMDPSPQASTETWAPLQNLATATGGALVRDPKVLDNTVLIVAPMENAASADAPPMPAAATSSGGLPVHTHLIRTQPLRAKSVNTDLGPMSGLLLVECPLNALEFQTDNRAGKFLVQAHVGSTIRDADGKVVWQTGKEITIKEPLKKLPARRGGNLYFMREIQLPGGRYTIEGTVDDLVSGKSGSASEPLHASDSLPGLAMSDPLFVRELKESSDRFDADQVLSFDRKTALAPLLDPVFPANQDFDLKIYFIIYPDLSGGKPDISIEIIHDGRALGRSNLPFQDEIYNTAADGGTMGPKGEQKHEFPFLATMPKASLDAGTYEARVTIRQGRNTVTRVVPFRIVSPTGGS
jgi:hypothetical protein